MRSYLRHAPQANTTRLELGNWLLNENDALRRKRALYANFIIWRKIRVIEKSVKRNLPFVTLWYTAEAVLEILSAYYRLAGDHIDWLDDLSPIGEFNIPDAFGELLLRPGALQAHFVRGEQQHLTAILWQTYRALQDRWRREEWVNKANLEDPLATQFEIEYWKYEGLFC
jgi:hypothetical protein